VKDGADKQIATTTGGAIGLSAVASFVGLCCIGPWAVTLFGVPGAVYLARWEPARPYILGLAVLMMMWAFWKVYGPRQICEDGTCEAGPSKWLKMFLWSGVVLLVLAIFAEQLQWLIVDPTPEGLRK
jgi:mercuric ion transport protein